jgi:hypothetical protein
VTFDGAIVASGTTVAHLGLPGAEVRNQGGHRLVVGPNVVGCGVEA